MGREDSDRFTIDPISGHVRALTSFAKEKGRVFGFDVKATDRRGAHDGKVAITNVFVSKKLLYLYCGLVVFLLFNLLIYFHIF